MKKRCFSLLIVVALLLTTTIPVFSTYDDDVVTTAYVLVENGTAYQISEEIYDALAF